MAGTVTCMGWSDRWLGICHQHVVVPTKLSLFATDSTPIWHVCVSVRDGCAASGLGACAVNSWAAADWTSRRLRAQKTPCASMASATLRKPAIFAPACRWVLYSLAACNQKHSPFSNSGLTCVIFKWFGLRYILGYCDLHNTKVADATAAIARLTATGKALPQSVEVQPSAELIQISDTSEGHTRTGRKAQSSKERPKATFLPPSKPDCQRTSALNL